MSKISNEMVEVNSEEFNDKDMINDIMQSLKDVSNNISIAISEMSSNSLFKEVMSIFKEVKELAREGFDISFKNGWYSIETADEDFIEEAIECASKDIKELEC